MRKVLVAVFTACLLALFLSTKMAFAQDVTVCPPGGGQGGCDSYSKIQEAINKAVPNSVITIPAGVRTEEGIDILNKDLTIRGAGAGNTIVQAATSRCGVQDRVFNISASRVKLQDLTIQNGCIAYPAQPGAGGGIWNSGSLTLQRVIVRNNMVAYNEQVPLNQTVPITWTPMGGGIYSVGSLIIDSSTITENLVTSTADKALGGGIYNNGNAHIFNTTISENDAVGRREGGGQIYGGGIYNSGDLDLEYTTVVNNAAEAAGGGLYNTGNIELANNLFSGNVSIAGGNVCADPGEPGPIQPHSDCDELVIGFEHAETTMPVYIPTQRSQSIDAGACRESKIYVDQRGYPRPQGAECDLGSIETGITFAPLIMAAPPMPDLIVRSVTVEPTGPLDASTKATVKIVIENIGNQATMENFYIDLFINPRETPPNHGGTTWIDLCRSDYCKSDKGIIWRAPPTVFPNERFTFTSDIDIDPYAVRVKPVE